MADKGWSVHLAATFTDLGVYAKDREKVQFHGIEFPRGMNLVSHLKAAKRLRNIVNDIEPDVVDIHFSAAAFTSALASQSSWPPVIVTVQGLRFPLASGLQRLILRTAECWAAKRAKKFYVLTKDDFDAMKVAGCSNVQQQEGYGFGCDLVKYDSSKVTDKELSSTLRQIEKNENDVVFLYIGRLVSFKGFNLVVQAFWQSFGSNSAAKLVVCGEFDALHPSGLSDDEVNRFKADENIIKLGWTNEVNRYLAVSDVVVFPSEREGVPVNLMESLAMGVPVITCNSRGCREVVGEGRLGIMLEHRNKETLVRAMKDLANNPEKRTSLSVAALEYREKFSRLHFVNNHIDVIQGEIPACNVMILLQ